jgi:hypothetical protein
MRPLTIGLTSTLFVLTTSAAAGAYCRSTTCEASAPPLACEPDAAGCPSAGAPLAWAGGCVGYSFQQSYTSKVATDEVRATVRAAFATWANADCGGGARPSIAFVELPEVACAEPEYNATGGGNANAIIFSEDPPWVQNAGEARTLSRAFVSYEEATGAINDVDLVVDVRTYDPANPSASFDLQAVLTHDIGHLLGLAHSAVPGATMNQAYELGSIDARDLSPDDVSAVCAAYPPDRQAVCDPSPRGGFAPACGGGRQVEAGALCGCSMGATAGARPAYAAALVVAAAAAAAAARPRGRRRGARG